MNIKKKALRALNPDLVFQNRRGRRVILSSKTTIGQLAVIGARVELLPQEKPMPPFAYGYIGDTTKVGNEGTKVTPPATGACYSDVF